MKKEKGRPQKASFDKENIDRPHSSIDQGRPYGEVVVRNSWLLSSTCAKRK